MLLGDDNRRRRQRCFIDLLLLIFTRVSRLVTHRLFRRDQSWFSLTRIDGSVFCNTSITTPGGHSTVRIWIFNRGGSRSVGGCVGDGVLMRYWQWEGGGGFGVRRRRTSGAPYSKKDLYSFRFSMVNSRSITMVPPFVKFLWNRKKKRTVSWKFVENTFFVLSDWSVLF